MSNINIINIGGVNPRPRYIISESRVLQEMQECPNSEIFVEEFVQKYLQFSMNDLDKASQNIVWTIFESLREKKFIEILNDRNIFRINKKGIAMKGEIVRKHIVDYEQVRDTLKRDEVITSRNGKKYKVLEKLGAGAVGVVYKVEEISSEQFFALKIMDPVLVKEVWSNARKRFILEGSRGKRLNHPNLIKIVDNGLYNDSPIIIDGEGKSRPFFIMEYIEGQNLYEYIKVGKYDFDTLFPLMVQIVKGLCYIHGEPSIKEEELENSELTKGEIEKSLVHRDIKPQNILIDKNGRLRIADLGIAKWKDIENSVEKLRQTGDISHLTTTIIGTKDYIAPEQKLNSHNVTFSADVFSLGLTFYYMITGLDFDRDAALSKDPSFTEQLDGRCPKRIKILILSMIKYGIENRPQCKEVLDILEGKETRKKDASVELISSIIREVEASVESEKHAERKKILEKLFKTPRLEKKRIIEKDVVPTLLYTPIDNTGVKLYVGGLLQMNGEDFIVSGKNIIWNHAKSGFHLDPHDEVVFEYYSMD